MRAVHLVGGLSALLAASFAIADAEDLIITEVVDGTLGGGNPKFVEITNLGATDYTFTAGGVIVQSNADLDYTVDVDLTNETILAGQSYVIQSLSNGGQAVFESTYGYAADLYTTAFFGNGDDRYMITDTADGSNVLDIYGQDGVDGTGTAWEYTDGYAFRLLTATTGNDGVFAIGEWTVSGINALETGDDWEEAGLLLGLTTPGWHPGMADCNNNGINDLTDIGNCDGSPWCSDINGNFIPDGCEPDCNGNGIPDSYDYATCAGDPACDDCNVNGVLDECDISSGGSLDANGNGVPDECEADTGWVINEIQADPDAVLGDANGDGIVNTAQDEFVEIVNVTGANVDISGWTISDAVQVRHTFPAGTVIENNCGIIVFGGGDPAFYTGDFGDFPVQAASSGSTGFNNGGDTVTFATDLAAIMDLVSYGSEGGQNQSITRDPDLTGVFVLHSLAVGSGGSLFSPGTKVDGTFFGGCTPPIDDCNGNLIDDAIDLANCDGSAWCQDCNSNGQLDECDLADGTSWDCNDNDIPDECDLVTGVLHDANFNGYPDECEIIPPATLRLNELRLNQPDDDLDEYVELKGDFGDSLNNIVHIVIGDASNDGDNSGVIESLTVLPSTHSIGFDGLYLIVEDQFTLPPGLAGADLIVSYDDDVLNFETSDNTTHLLVANFNGHLGQDLDINDDGVLDVVPWTVEIDSVALIEEVGLGDQIYSTTTVGPDATFPPGHAYYCAPDWVVGHFDPADPTAADTPAAENDCATGCPEDLADPAGVEQQDLNAVLNRWGDPDCLPAGAFFPCPEDLATPDGVEQQDLNAVLNRWGDPECEPAGIRRDSGAPRKLKPGKGALSL